MRLGLEGRVRVRVRVENELKVGTSGAYSLRILLRNSSAPAVKVSKALR